MSVVPSVRGCMVGVRLNLVAELFTTSIQHKDQWRGWPIIRIISAHADGGPRSPSAHA